LETAMPATKLAARDADRLSFLLSALRALP
jgi:hypothetical protein